jgi:pimeloyl-ACP methyl ester carboxylesterase
MTAVNFALLHGGGQGSWIWAETIAALKAQSDGSANCVSLDVPGCGAKRARDTSAIEFDDIARELNADIEAAGMRDVVLVGHSQGGTVIPRMVELAPNLFSRLIYVTCDAPPPGIRVIKLMGSCLHGEREDRIGWPLDPKTTSLQDLYRVMFCNDMPPHQRDEFLAELDQDMWPLSSYTHQDWHYDRPASMPATYVLCLQDMSLPLGWQKRFAERLRVDRTLEIDAGHQVMNSQPQTLAKVLLAEVDGDMAHSNMTSGHP